MAKLAEAFEATLEGKAFQDLEPEGDEISSRARWKGGYDHVEYDDLRVSQTIKLCADEHGLTEWNVGFISVGSDELNPNRLYIIDLMLGNCALVTNQEKDIIEGDDDPGVEEEIRRLLACF